MMNYEQYIESKKIKAPACGFHVERENMNHNLFDWQKDIVYWALKKGRAALFEDCGLGKTIQQLAWSHHVSEYTKKPVLIVAPLAVAEQTKEEGRKFGFQVSVCRKQEDVKDGINICNYEMLNHFEADMFGGVVLDESSILKNYSGKMRNQIIDMFRDIPYRLSCTATPSPNDYMELGNQAEFLGTMKRSEMLATFFVHDGGNTSKWRLKGHAQKQFWKWVAGWAVVLTNPSDLGYSGEGYGLPGLYKTEHIVKINYGEEGKPLICEMAKTLSERRTARRNSLEERCKTAAEIVKNRSGDQWLVWCDLNDESKTLTDLIPDAVEIRGSDKPEIKAERLKGFTAGTIKCLVTKPSIAGFGLNWQGCHNMIFVGLSDSYEMMYQAIRRCWRFGQENDVNVHIITSEEEGAVKENIERKEKQSEQMIAEMVRHTKDILESEIHGTVRMTAPYNPKIEMIIPIWLTKAV